MSAINDKCRQVEQLTWDGMTFSVGERITFDDAFYAAVEERRTRRVVGTIRELWLESWRAVDDLAYAEVNGDGEEFRCWFHRDHARLASGLELEAGAAPEGALW